MENFIKNGEDNKISLLTFYLILSIIGVNYSYIFISISFLQHYYYNLLIFLIC